MIAPSPARRRSAAFAQLLGAERPSGAAAGALVGLEHEFRIIRSSLQLDFRAHLDGLALGERNLDPVDPNAFRLDSGAVLTSDAREAEIALAPERRRPGFAARIAARAFAERDRLVGLVGPGLEGYSTHISVALPQRINDRVAFLYARTFAPALMLLMDRWDSPGLMVRPRPGRLELCGEYVEGGRLRACVAFAVGSVLACVDALAAHPRRVPMPPSLIAQVLPTDQRYGWYVDRRAFGTDLYATGRMTRLQRAGGGATSAQEQLSLAVGAAVESLGTSARSDDLVELHGMASGELPLPSEALAAPEDRAVLPIAPSALGRALVPRRRPSFAVAPVMVTWDTLVFVIAETTTARRAFACVPRERLAAFIALLDRGRLDAAIADYLALRPRGRALSSWEQTAVPGLYDAIGARRELVARERPVAAPARVGPRARRLLRFALGGAAAALFALAATGLSLTVAAANPPRLSSIIATFSRPITSYRVTVTPGDGGALTYVWTNTNSCGTFGGTQNFASWAHPDPPCPQEDVHPGTITVVASDGVFRCVATYPYGSAPGTGPDPGPCGPASEAGGGAAATPSTAVASTSAGGGGIGAPVIGGAIAVAALAAGAMYVVQRRRAGIGASGGAAAAVGMPIEELARSVIATDVRMYPPLILKPSRRAEAAASATAGLVGAVATMSPVMTFDPNAPRIWVEPRGGGGQVLPGTPAYVSREQPFQIVVQLKRTGTPADTIDVKIATESGTATITLRWDGATSGPVVYRSKDLTLRSGGEGGGRTTVFGFEFSSGGFSGVSTENGGTVRISADGLNGSFKAYETGIQAALGAYLDFVNAAGIFWTEVLSGVQGMPDGELKQQLTEEAQVKIQLVNHARQSLLNDKMVDNYKIGYGAAYVHLLRSYVSPSAWHIQEHEALRTADVYAQDARSFFWWNFTKDLAVGLYQAILSQTIAGQFYTVFTGRDIFGRKVGGWDYALTVIDLASQAAFTAAGVKFSLDTTVGRTTGRIPRPLEVGGPLGPGDTQVIRVPYVVERPVGANTEVMPIPDVAGNETAVLPVPDFGRETAVLQVPDLPPATALEAAELQRAARLADVASGVKRGFTVTQPADPSGVLPTHPIRGGMVAILGDDVSRFAKNIAAVKPLPGYFDVVVHGTPRGFEIWSRGQWVDITLDQVIRAIRAGGYTGGPIRLISCNSGHIGFGPNYRFPIADALARQLGVKVLAPNRYVAASRDGRLWYSSHEDMSTAKEFGKGTSGEFLAFPVQGGSP